MFRFIVHLKYNSAEKKAQRRRERKKPHFEAGRCPMSLEMISASKRKEEKPKEKTSSNSSLPFSFVSSCRDRMSKELISLLPFQYNFSSLFLYTTASAPRKPTAKREEAR